MMESEKDHKNGENEIFGRQICHFLAFFHGKAI